MVIKGLRRLIGGVPATKAVNLDTPLLRLSKHDYFRLRDAVQHVLALGGTGSGKTSGSGAALARAYLRAGMGGLVLVAKPEDAEMWRRYCRETGRTKSLIEIDGQNGQCFNFLAYETERLGVDGLNSVVECLMRVIEAARIASGDGGRAGDVFWTDTNRQIFRAAIYLLHTATGRVTIVDILALLRSAPRSLEEAADPAWQQRSFLFRTLEAAARQLGDTHPLIGRIASYWYNDFATLDARTRGNIVISLTTLLDRFNYGWLNATFCGGTTVVPELTFHGAVILLNLPALTRNEDGIIAAHIVKYMWQRAVLSRNDLPAAQRIRPVFCWADEAQYFVNSYDAEFLATARGSLAAMVYLSQSLPTFYARIGGDNARDRVHHLLGNFSTKIWHSNACPETNEWASRTIGRSLHWRGNYSQGEGSNTSRGLGINEGTNWGSNFSSGTSYSSGGGGSSRGSTISGGSSRGGSDGFSRNCGSGTSFNSSRGGSEQMDHLIEPAEFARILKTGGRANRGRVSAMWFQSGRTFADSGMNILLAEFQQ